MNLKRIKIDDFRNLKNFEITFTQFKLDVNTGEEKEIQTHAIIGQNGAGKSNLIEEWNESIKKEFGLEQRKR